MSALLLLPGISYASAGGPSSSSSVRARIDRIEAELESLPIFPESTSPWTLGYSSAHRTEPELPLQIDIDFPEPAVVDLVVLMPSSITDQRNQFQSWGFPIRFKMECLLRGGGRTIIADFLDKDYPAPGIEPQLFPCPNPVRTTGLRITVTQPAPNSTWWRAEQVVSFSELFAFAGERNVALNSEVTATSSNEHSFIWSTKCLTDGFTFFYPMFHDLESPKTSINGYGLKELNVDLDLGEVHPVDEFHLWPIVHSVQYNFPTSAGLGFPLNIRLEGSMTRDFSNPQVLYENSNLLYRPGAGPFMQRTPSTKVRFLRFRFRNGFPDFMSRFPNILDRIAVSEIAILSNGENVSLGIPVKAPNLKGADRAKIESLTDGRSNEGQILPLRKWLMQFKRRVQLEAALESLRRELDAAQLEEQQRFRILIFAAVGCILILVQIIFWIRSTSRRRAAQMRERMAGDLHDEIGANVSSIAHTSELLAESMTHPTDTQKRLLKNLITNARLTYREIKHFIRFIEGETRSTDLFDQFTEVADQILGTIPKRFTMQNRRTFNALNSSDKWNLLLFYKEALNNVIKHANASQVDIWFGRVNGQYKLEVTDNGCGFTPSERGCRHLEQRAALLKGRLEVQSPSGGGTKISLIF